MQSTIFDTPVLKVESLKSKFDTNVLSNSVVTLLDDNYTEARILQQLHYWCYSQYGVVIDGIRWIYKPLKEWISEALAGVTNWKLRVAIASLLEKGLIKREKLYVKHHELKHNNPYWNPKNQTYYYSVNYDKLQELIEQVENQEKPETIENVRIEDSTKLSVENFTDTKCCELSQNNTKSTSIENSSKDKSHPTLPCVSEAEKKEKDQRKQDSSNPELPNLEEADFVNPQIIEKEINIGQVEENINQNICTDKRVVQEVVRVEVEKPVTRPRVKTAKGTKTVSKRMKSAPWKDEGQFKRFYRALIRALPIVANARSPQGLAQVIIRQLRSGIPHSYWDDFIAGLPIGMTDKPEWEIEPGVPYPMFIEYLTEKLKAGNNTKTDEQTRNEVFSILEKPRQAKAFWGQFKRSVVNVSEQVERDRALGVSSPSTPVWTRERIEPSVEEAAEAGKKIMAINGAAANSAIAEAQTPQLETKDFPSVPKSPEDPWSQGDCSQPDPQPNLKEMLAQRKIKGFAKAMPPRSQAEIEAEERAEIKPKTNIARMSLVEINDYLQDPILRAQLMPQLWDSDYELITDELGQIIGVKLSDLQIRETLKGKKQ